MEILSSNIKWIALYIEKYTCECLEGRFYIPSEISCSRNFKFK